MKRNPLQILLVEDDAQQRQLVANILSQEGHDVVDVDGVESAILAIKQRVPDVVFCDWKLGALTGLSLLNYVRQHHPEVGFAIATAYGTIAHAVEAIDAGADDYLAKPFQRQALLLCIDKIAKARLLRLENIQLNSALSSQHKMVDLVGNAPSMQKVYERIERVSNTDATVLVLGESGTGKELVARALHKMSSRVQHQFVAVNCGAIPETLAEAEFFGAKKGAFTGATADKPGKFQLAHNGTLFLDEIGELPLSLQAKILRFLQEGTISPLGDTQEIELNVRVIAATHRDLKAMIKDGTFREDLFYRLNIVPIDMPPLRERIEDIAPLVEFFRQKFHQQYRIPIAALPDALLTKMCQYPWPGNVRELSNRVERFVLLGDETELVPDKSSESHSPSETGSSRFTLPDNGIDWETFERDILGQALTRAEGNRTRAAQLLSLSYKAFLYRLEKHNLV